MGHVILWFGSQMTEASFISHTSSLGCQTSNFGPKQPWVCTIRLNTKPDWKVHFSSWLQFVLKQQPALTTKTQLLSCQGTKTDLCGFHCLNQETNSLISFLNQPLNYRKRLPNASKPWSPSLCSTFQLRLLYTVWNELESERRKKNSRHPFILCKAKSADYCNKAKHLLGFILLIYSRQLSYSWRAVRLEAAGDAPLFLPILIFLSFSFCKRQ